MSPGGAHLWRAGPAPLLPNPSLLSLCSSSVSEGRPWVPDRLQAERGSQAHAERPCFLSLSRAPEMAARSPPTVCSDSLSSLQKKMRVSGKNMTPHQAQFVS